MADPKTQQDVLMPLAQVKRMLGMAESGPLGCAFGLTKDKKECLLLVEKTGSGKKIGSKLKADGKDLTLDVGTVRFGTVISTSRTTRAPSASRSTAPRRAGPSSRSRGWPRKPATRGS